MKVHVHSLSELFKLPDSINETVRVQLACNEIHATDTTLFGGMKIFIRLRMGLRFQTVCDYARLFNRINRAAGAIPERKWN